MKPTDHPAGHVLQAFHDGELAADERTTVEAHCDQCAECRDGLAELAATAVLLAASPAPELPRTVWHRVKPSRAHEPRFKPVFALAAGVAGVALGILIGPIQMSDTSADESTTWSESVMIWSGETTSPLLNVFPSGQD